MECPRCHASVADGAQFCGSCGSSVGLPGAPAAGDNPVSYVIPYRNPMALAAYYLGIFSLIPCIGGILGFIAFPLGIVGLRAAARREQAHGRVHAWVGIVAGGLSALAHLAFLALALSSRLR